MRKPLLVIGSIILLVSVVFLMGSIYEEYFSVSISIVYEEEVIHQEKCPISIWHRGMKERSGSFERLFDKTVSEGHSSVAALNFLSEGLGDRMLKLSRTVETRPVNAELKVADIPPYFVYKEDTDGKIVNFDDFARKVACALDKGSARLTVQPKKADVTTEKLRLLTSLRGKFCTNFSHSTFERKHNIKLALSSINGYILQSNEEFSFNAVVGERKPERGYKKAKIISQGKFVEGVGGGVCQVSTTLYNAVLLSDLAVTHATRHSLPVSYVEPSRDAMVSSSNDFKFVNSSSYPIYIFTNSDNNKATIEIYGQVSYSLLRLKSEVIKIIAYNNYIVDGTRLACPNGYRQLSIGKNGLESELYLIKDGVSKRIRRDMYLPQHALWVKEEEQTIYKYNWLEG